MTAVLEAPLGQEPRSLGALLASTLNYHGGPGGFTIPTPILETRRPRLSLLRVTSVHDGVRAQTRGHTLNYYSHHRLGQNSKVM